MLKASLQDIPILDGYLHDAYFKPDDIAFNADKRCFTMDIERVCYERAMRGKVCFLIPVIRYPWIHSHITMNGVESVNQKWNDRGVDGPDNKQLLMDIENKSGNIIVFGSTHLRITLTVSSDFEFILIDEPKPEDVPLVIDFSKGIFYGMGEINKLRVETQTTNSPNS